MKKGLGVVSLALILIVSLSVIISAGFFSEFWGRITGNVINCNGNNVCDENENCLTCPQECPAPSSEYECDSITKTWVKKTVTPSSTTPKTSTCTDSDIDSLYSGLNMYVAGNCTDQLGISYDTCTADNLGVNEFYCSSGSCLSINLQCSPYHVCSDGKCVISTTTPTNCEDCIAAGRIWCKKGMDEEGNLINYCAVLGDTCSDNIKKGIPVTTCPVTSSELPDNCEDCIALDAVDADNIYWCTTTNTCHNLNEEGSLDCEGWYDSPNGIISSSTSEGCPAAFCGDGVCNGEETSTNCFKDCGHRYNLETCEACVGKSYTWCTDPEECVDDPVGSGCVGDKINFKSDCLSLGCESICGSDKKTLYVKSLIAGECKDLGARSCTYGCRDGACASADYPTKCDYNPEHYSSDAEITKFISAVTGAGCGLNPQFRILDELPEEYNFNVKNRKIVKILEIENIDTGALLNLTLNETELGLSFPIENVTVYVEKTKSAWEPLVEEDIVEIKAVSGATKTYKYVLSVDHFSLFLITEPDLCGNEIFDSDYEDCDSSISGVTDCTSCVCDAGFDADGEGNCVEDIEGTECDEEGDESCRGYTYYTCGDDLTWDKEGIIIGECEVECIKGNSSCQGEYPIKCGADYEWHIQQKIIGQCGYTVTTTSGGDVDRCGNGYCNYDEDEFSCPEDCAEEKSKSDKTILIVLIVAFSILILVVVFVLLKIFNKERKRGTPSGPDRRIPPEHRPGPKREPGRPAVIRHGEIGRPPVRRVSPGGYSVRKYPVQRYPPR